VKARPCRGGTAAFNQRGFALIAILSLVALFSAYLISIGISRSSADLSNEREDRSMSALRQAKTALISYAANEQWQLYKSQSIKQPGALPCPDDGSVGPGISRLSCSGASPKIRIGRLPYSTIGSDDLRDASGERLWYAVSSSFYKNSLVTVINSDTPGLLTVTGTAPASNVVAIVFAPGPAGQDSTLPPGQIQDRSPANINRLESYLEGFTPVGSDSSFTTTAFPTDTFNDRLLVITQAELMAAVEPVVAARIERDVKQRIQSYFSDWGIYPFAAPFAPAGPGVPMSQYKGGSQTNGLLPLTTDSTFAGWQISSISVTQIVPQPPAGTGSSTLLASTTCSSSTGSQIVCQIDYSGGSTDRPDIRLQATLLNVARSFLRPIVQIDKSMTDFYGIPIDWSSAGSPPLTPTVSNTLQASGDATVIFTGRLQDAASTNNRVTITVPVSYNPITNINDATSGWFIANEWFRQTYYAVSPGFLLGGGNTCNPLPPPPTLPPPPPPPYCLTVNKLPPSYTTSNDKVAILVLAGRALNGSSRPSGTFANYFENANLSAAQGTTPYVYEHRAGGPTSINDRVVVISP
jgi:type II secretory pathway pseudopilin PulG